MAKKQERHKENPKRRPQNSKKRGDKKPISRRTAIDKQVKDPNAKMRLNKYISNSGVCSRREADIFIEAGSVTVNGKVITEMGYKVNPSDDVRFDGRRLNPEKKEYVLLNKPSGFFVTGSLEKRNRTVMDLVAKASKSKIVPVGSFETNSKGLLLFTNDGTLEKKLAKKPIRQIFEVELNSALKADDLGQLKEGIRLREGLIKPREVSYVDHNSKKVIGIELSSNVPHIIQKLFSKLGYEVVNLDRVVYGGLTKKNLPRGEFRHLKRQEIINLGMI